MVGLFGLRYIEQEVSWALLNYSNRGDYDWKTFKRWKLSKLARPRGTPAKVEVKLSSPLCEHPDNGHLPGQIGTSFCGVKKLLDD